MRFARDAVAVTVHFGVWAILQKALGFGAGRHLGAILAAVALEGGRFKIWAGGNLGSDWSRGTERGQLVAYPTFDDRGSGCNKRCYA